MALLLLLLLPPLLLPLLLLLLLLLLSRAMSVWGCPHSAEAVLAAHGSPYSLLSVTGPGQACAPPRLLRVGSMAPCSGLVLLGPCWALLLVMTALAAAVDGQLLLLAELLPLTLLGPAVEKCLPCSAAG